MKASDWAEWITKNTAKYVGIPYDQLDCQALVERLLRDGAGIKKDWRGSNHMWRDAVAEKSNDFSVVQPGEWLFTIKHDGGEPSTYKDGVNAAHVGVYIGNGIVIHSTTGGVQLDQLTNRKRWTHHAKCKLLDYGKAESDVDLFQNIYGELVAIVNKYGGEG